LVSNDFWLFPEVTDGISGYSKHKKKNVTTLLKAIPPQEFQKFFQQWQHHWVTSA
jgi:hypothetical protein